MHRYLAGLIAIAAFVAGGITTFLATDPIHNADLAQKAMLDQYLKIYCDDHPPRDFAGKIFASGEAAALSRTTIAAGLGELALGEYAKCRLRK